MFRQLLCVTLSFFLCAAIAQGAPQNVEELQEKLEEIENAEIPEEHKEKAREHIRREMEKARGRQRGGRKDEKGKDGEKKEGGDNKDKEKKEEANTVKRPDEPKKPADPEELEALPSNGKLVLQFRGHPWPDMIDWYSRATGQEVEWQELPKGFVNVRTQRALTMDETGDLFNRLLLARGFTMLDSGDFLQIVKTEGLNPAFVPRVAPQKLATMMPHSFARTSFQLQRFKAEDIVKELEAMKSQHGKLTAMTAANRIEAMDTVVNLRDIYNALDQEQSSGVHKPREFEIKYVRADIVKKKLEEMLGIQSTSADSGKQKNLSRRDMEMQMMQKRMEFEMARQRAQQNRGKPNQEQAKPEKISLIVNDIKNSIIVKAPPHRMLDIADAIELLDVAPDGSVLDIQAYTLATRDPQELADMLEESGALSPTAMVRVDSKTKTLLISGSKFDHFQVRELIKTIDGNARRFVSIRLRRHPAAQVAATIEKMMGGGEDEGSNRRRYGWWWDEDQEKEDPNDKFRVTADVENNKLILKCNDAEYEVVMDLLTQMGEVLTRSRFASNEVVLSDIAPGLGEDELLQRVKKAFEAYAPNQVILPPPREEPVEQVEEDPEADSSDEEKEAVDIGARTTSVLPRTTTMYTQLIEDDETEIVIEGQRTVRPTVAQRPAKTVLTEATPQGGIDVETTDRQLPSNQRTAQRRSQKKEPPPIIIERNAQGKLVIRSEDAEALEMFEELMRTMAPTQEDWISFRLKHVSAYWMKLQLEDFFKDDDGGPQYVFWDYWDYQRSQGDKSPPGLGEERKMRFIDDGVSTLVVRNASAKQLATVKRLIDLYDVTEPPNKNSARYKKIIQIKYSKARTIENTLKEAFRDLLSSNDKAFENQNRGDEDKGNSRRFYGFGFGMGDDDDSGGLGSGSTFKGKLSFGVDESTNILIVTAQGKPLLELVIEMVEELDKAAVPSDDTRIVTLPPNLTSAAVRESLARMFGKQDGARGNGQGGEQQPPNEGGERGEFRGEGRGRRGK